MNIPGLEGVFLFQAQAGEYILRINCQNTKSSGADFIKGVYQEGVESTITNNDIGTVVTFKFKTTNPVDQRTKIFLYLAEEYAYGKDFHTPAFSVLNFKEEAHFQSSKYWPMDTTFRNCFPYMVRKYSGGNYDNFTRPGYLLSNSFVTRELFAFDRLVNLSHKELVSFTDMVGREEAERVFSSIKSVVELEKFLKTLPKIKDKYITFKSDSFYALPENLYQHVLTKLKEQKANYQILDLDNYTITVSHEFSSSEHGTKAVCKINVVSGHVLRVDIQSIRDSEVDKDLYSQPPWVGVMRKWLKRDIEAILITKTNKEGAPVIPSSH